MTPQKSTDRVKCFVRIRPSSNFAHQNIEILPGENTEIKNKILQLKSNNSNDSNFANKPVADNLQKSWKFNVDDVLYNAGQMQVYDTVAKSLVEKAMDGYSGTLVAYGESGSGKTFTGVWGVCLSLKKFTSISWKIYFVLFLDQSEQ